MWYEGPMYENAGPKAKDVRVDMISRVKWFNLKTYPSCLSPQQLKSVINKIVPDSRNDFGSYRNYYCIRDNIINQIGEELKEFLIKDIRKRRAKRILKRKLLPLIIHKLYKPGGLRYKVAKKDFERKQNLKN